MTAPAGPPTKVDEARTALHAALVLAMAACGWPEERAVPLPPRQIVPPMAWVDVPTMEPSTQAGASAVTATFPVAVVVDGADSAQAAQLDRLLAHGWAELSKVARARVLSAGPQLLDVGGVETRALVFSVRSTLMIRTLCGGSVTDSDEAPAPEN